MGDKVVFTQDAIKSKTIQPSPKESAKAKAKSKFRQDYPFEKRRAEALRILDKHPGRVPVIVEVAHTEKNLPKLEKCKYIVPKDITLSQFLCIIRKNLKLSEAQALFMFVGDNVIPPISTTIGILYDEYHEEDFFMLAIICSENCFGSCFSS